MYINIERIEFTVTDACSGNCKHCSNGGHRPNRGSVDADAAVAAVEQLVERYQVKSLMTFGGEPLLYAETTCRIHAAARDNGIPIRQIITNGFFSRDERRMEEVANALCESGANDVLLSVDAFHQEYIPIEPVMYFADALIRCGIPSLRVHPAWLVNENHDNPYNAETKRLLKLFTDKGIKANQGNNIFAAGNAVKYLSDWFPSPEDADLSVPCGSAPYTSRPDEIDSFCLSPNGDVRLCSITIGNICRQGALDLLDSYDPYSMPAVKAVLDGGVPELVRYAKAEGMDMDISDCRSACEVCRRIMAAIENR